MELREGQRRGCEGERGSCRGRKRIRKRELEEDEGQRKILL